MPELTVLATALGVGLLLLLILWLSIRIVNRGDKLVVYRLGNTDELERVATIDQLTQIAVLRMKEMLS